MRKLKLFSLIMCALLACTSVWAADEIIFSADAKTTSDKTFPNGTTEITSTDANITGGKVYAISGQSDAKKLLLSSGRFSMTNNNTIFKFELNSALAEGDIITIDGQGGTKSGVNKGLWITTTEDRPTEAPACSGDNSTDSWHTPILEYVVTNSDDYVGQTILYVHRQAGATQNFDNVVITRPAPTKDYTITATTSTGDNTRGTVSSNESTLDEGETATITAVPAEGYRVSNWAVSGAGATISPNGASHSNTTTLTVGTADATVTVTFEPIPVSSITISPSPATVKVGKTKTLEATIAPANALDKAVTWSVKSGSTYASVVEATGVVTGLAAGTAVITATAHDGSGVTQDVTVNVEECPTSGTMYKFQVKTGLTNGNIASSVPQDIPATTENYLSEITGGELTIEARNSVNRVQIFNNNAIGFANGADAFLKMDLDCDIEVGDSIKYAITDNDMILRVGSESESTNKMTLLRNATAVVVDSKLVGASVLYMNRSNSSPKITYFEIYRPAKYTLTWDFAYGSCSATEGDDYTAAGSVIEGAAITYPENNSMSKDGYKFAGWSSSATTMPGSDLTITAQWAPVYTVTYDATTGSGTMTDANSPYAAGDEVTLLENTFEAPDASSAWSGWDVYKTGDATTKVTVTDGKFTMPAYNVTVAAQWATAYDVKFFQGYGEPDVQIGETQSIGEGAFAIAPADPERAGYQFAGWSYDATKAHIVNVAEYAIKATTNFTAIWDELYAITKAEVTNGSITVSAENAIEGATVTLTATPATDYLFDAWDVYKTGDESTKVTVTDNSFTMPAYAVTVSASFIADIRTKILYVTKNSADDTKANDKLYAALKNDYNIHIVGPASTEKLTDYSLAILHESIDGKTEYNASAVAAAKTGNVPVLNTKSYFYSDGRWAWGTPNAGKNVKGCSLNSTTYQYVSYHPIFADVVDKDGFLEIIDEAEAKAMQPVGSFTTGLEGYTLATTPNESSGNGCAIHEIPAGNSTRGANTGKYLMISVSKSALGKLNANGQKLFQNAVAYLLSNSAWTPEYDPTALDNTDVNAKAVKRLDNGMLVIEKNGVRYNAMGQTIR